MSSKPKIKPSPSDRLGELIAHGKPRSARTCETCANPAWQEAVSKIAARLRQPSPPRIIQFYEAFTEPPHRYSKSYSGLLLCLNRCHGFRNRRG